MGLKEKKKPHKEKNKRKRGKKYKYDPEKEASNKIIKLNPFEAFSQKKFQKKNNNSFSQLISEYQSKNVVNSFKDKRIAENSNLSYDEKMKLRYKAQQLLKKTKKSKFAFDNENSDENSEEEIKLTHKGKEINDLSDNDDLSDNNDEDEYYEKMNEYIENLDSNKKLTKQEKFKAIIMKSKKLKEEKHRIKEDNLNKIDFLNDNFEEINSLLKKRKRTFNRLNDDYDKIASNYIYSERIHPTERIKSKEEIEQEKEKKMKKMEMERLKEEVDEEESFDEEKNENDLNEKHLTKKERIEKLIQERLGKMQKKKDREKNMINNKGIKLKEEDDDDLSDLNELDQEGDNDEEDNENEEYEESEGEENNENEGEEDEDGSEINEENEEEEEEEQKEENENEYENEEEEDE